ncbi:hypothetical protein KBZ12_10800 [Cyanobium sp. Cruz CV13-4-11]|uniref:hypothetical protein n=1 Tax=unclassified Cyanobium TaxID=2627006 RepID=UPI0020CC57F3|nr:MULTISPECIES: hypothetical protein [unclassified Cyanobium]MCP9901742.1 hypothetical protein [Cyanobium sp. Cruz CV11-17]MCP9919958.1 hypothetical protein [Cyanobium sp. Cruz CV13-4-11]
MKLAALLAVSSAILIAAPTHGQVRTGNKPEAPVRVDFVRCSVTLAEERTPKIIATLPCTNLEVSNTDRTINVHYTSEEGTTTFFVDNNEAPDQDGDYAISGTIFVPRGKKTYRRLPTDEGGYCSFTKVQMLCYLIIEGKILFADAALE